MNDQKDHDNCEHGNAHVAANSCYVGIRIIYLSINPPSNTNSLS